MRDAFLLGAYHQTHTKDVSSPLKVLLTVKGSGTFARPSTYPLKFLKLT